MADQREYQTHFKNQQDRELIKLALHKSPFFSCLAEEQVDLFVATAELKSWKQGEIVILEGCVDEEESEEQSTSSDDNITELTNNASSLPSLAPETADGFDDVGAAEADDYYMEDDDESEYAPVDKQLPVEKRLNSDDKPPEESANARDEPNSTDDNTIDSNPLQGVSDSDQTEQHVGSKPSPSPSPSSAVAVPQESSIHSSFLTARTDLEALYQATPLSTQPQTNEDATSSVHPPPPKSGIPRSLYIVRQGNAGVWYQPHFNPANLGPGTLFGEGGFLFGRQHSASVVASEPMECWVVDISTFRNHVLPSESMRQIFHKRANKTDDAGEPFMSMDDFVEAVAAQQSEGNTLPTLQDSLVSLRIAHTYNILRHNHSRQQSPGETKIYLNDFCFFIFLMARPDPEVDIAFLLMDEKQSGQIFLDDLAKFLRPVFPNLDFGSQFFQRYFGKDGNQSIRQIHFSQFLVDLQREMGKQAFLKALEENGTQEGYLPPEDFVRTLKTAGGWRLPQGVSDRLEVVYCRERNTSNDKPKNVEAPDAPRPGKFGLPALGGKRQESQPGDQYFAYGDFLAFQEVLGNLPFICNLIDKAQELKKGPVSPDDFKVANQVLGLGGRLSRRQVEIVFSLFDLDEDGYLSREDTVNVCGVDFARRLVPVQGRGDRLTFAPPPQFRAEDEIVNDRKLLVESVFNKAMAAGVAFVVGGFSVGILYPLDTVKTRLMNQRIGTGGTRMYKGSLDCLQQVVRAEGVAGLYRGMLPQLLGVAPERMIKLQVHDLLSQAFNSPDDSESGGRKATLWLEASAGGCAGACQVLVTNPTEFPKIRLQMEGETSRLLLSKGITPPAPSAFTSVIKDLGFPGVYRGASACLLRDVPFSAIYFPLYAVFKESLVEQNGIGKARPSDILLAGTVAAVPAAVLTTPADVVKTRLQSIARPGEASYQGIRDCATKIYHQEGIFAFFQGSSIRAMRLAPPFGISLFAYECMAELFGFQRASRPPTTAPIDPRDYSAAFPLPHGYFDRWFR